MIKVSVLMQRARDRMAFEPYKNYIHVLVYLELAQAAVKAGEYEQASNLFLFASLASLHPTNAGMFYTLHEKYFGVCEDVHWKLMLAKGRKPIPIQWLVSDLVSVPLPEAMLSSRRFEPTQIVREGLADIDISAF